MNGLVIAFLLDEQVGQGFGGNLLLFLEASFGKERIVLTRRGRDLAALVPIEDLELLEQLEDRLDLDAARAALQDAAANGTVVWDKIKADLAL